MATLTTNWQNIASWTYSFQGYGNSVTFYLDAKYSSQSIANNTTDIQTRLRSVLSSGSAYGGGYSYTCSYAPTVSGTGRWNFETETITSGSGTITHNSDGTKSITLSATVANTTWGFNHTLSATVSLPSIPRQANLVSAPDFTDEENPTVTYSNPAGNSVNELVISIYNTTGSVAYAPYRAVNKTGTLSYTFDLTNEERTALRQACTGNSMAVRFYLRTYLGGTYYYSYIQKTMTIVNSNPTFNDFTFEDTNSTTVALTGNNQNVIKGYSNVTATISTANKATANKEATISKYRFSSGTNTPVDFNYSEDSDVSGTINNITDGIFTLYAIDSRGNSTSVVKQANRIIDYSNITKGSINAKRSNGVSKETTLSFNGTWWNDNFGSVSNTLSAKYKYKKSSESSYPSTTTPLTLTIDNNNYSFSGLIAGDEGAEGFDINYSYDIQVIVEDELSSVTFTTQLASGIPHIAYAKNGVSIMGKYNDSVGGLLQVGGQRIDNADSLPIGSIVDYDGNTVPDGYELVNSYSTTEVKTGDTWINDKPIYRKVVDMGALPNVNSKFTPHNISNLETVVDVKGMAFNPTTRNRVTLPYADSMSQYIVQLFANDTNVVLNTAYDQSAFSESFAIIEYTKTTD